MAGGTVMWVAAVGITVNTVSALLFMGGRKGDLNVKGAFLHMAANATVQLERGDAAHSCRLALDHVV